MNNEYIIGIDISTVVLGYTVLDYETKKLEDISYYKFESSEMLEKSFELKKFIIKLNEKYKIKKVFIEESLQTFAGGLSSAKTIIKLAQINFCCQLYCKELNIEFTLISAMSARNICFPGFSKGLKLIKVKYKDRIFDLVKKKLGEEKFPTKILKSGINKGKKVFLEEAKDMSDSWILASAGILLTKQK